MNMRRFSLTTLTAAAAALLALGACSSSSTGSTNPVEGNSVKDTLGNRFELSCGSAICTLISADLNITAKSCEIGYGTDYFVLVLSNVLTIMTMPITSTGEYQLATANPAKPVACTVDSDCLTTTLAVTVDAAPLAYACQSGICRLPGQPLLTSDIVTLCQSDLPWPTSCPYATDPKFASRLVEVSASCGSKFACDKIPAVCTPGAGTPDGGVSVDAPTVDGAALDVGGGEVGH